jgi:NADH-ubiquinone oxidoreductase chain 5
MHVVNHAFFKALLFLGAGAVIHSFADQQDVRRLGGLIKFLPFTYTAMLVGSLSLLATPWLTGFYSKDLIIELAYGHYSFSGTYAFILGTLTAGITAFYSFRLICLVFLTYPNAPKNAYLNSHEANLAVIVPLFVLALFSIFFGFVFSDLFIGLGSDFFGNSLYIHPSNISIVEAEFSLPIYIKLLPAIVSLLGATLALVLYHNNSEFIINLSSNELGKKVYTFLNGKYLFDVIYNNYIISKGLNLGYGISKLLDRGVIELVGPYGISSVLIDLGKTISKLDTGLITTYALYMTLGALGLVFIVFSSFFTVSLESHMQIYPIIIFLILLYIQAPTKDYDSYSKNKAL